MLKEHIIVIHTTFIKNPQINKIQRQNINNNLKTDVIISPGLLRLLFVCCSSVLIAVYVSFITTAGNLLLGGSPYLSVQQGKLILTIPGGIQLTSLPLKPVAEASPFSANGLSHLLASSTPPVVSTAQCPTPGGLASSPLHFINSSLLYGAPETGTPVLPSPHVLDQSVTPTGPNTLTPESLLTLSPMYSGVTSNIHLAQPAWSPVPLSTSASLTLFDIRGKGDLTVDPALLGLPGGESLLLGSPSPEHDVDVNSAMGDPEEMDGDSKILTQLQSVPVDDDLGL